MNDAGSLWFIDTNVLLYEVDGSDRLRQATARHWLEILWERRVARVSWQVLNEFYANATGKIGAPPPLIRRLVETYTSWGVVDASFALLQRAWHWVDQAGVSYWDALILAAAERSGCQWLLSEDFQHERSYGTIRVLNPFLTEPAGFFAS